jgi:DNA-directed RNA polymerase subunit RPC12/RpoP
MCGKSFEKPIVLTDPSNIVRETYYACPHCRSRIEINVEDPNHPQLVSVKDMLYIGQRAPINCPHYLGYLRDLQDEKDIPDKCAICPKIMQCFIKKSS